jgi:hypothetical protein
LSEQLFSLASPLAAAVLMLDGHAHTVGAAVGLPGLPFVNGSLAHGDPRVAHFLGIDAQQLVPLAAAALSRWRPGWPAGRRAGAVAAFAGACAGVVALRAAPALAGRPLLALLAASGGAR